MKKWIARAIDAPIGMAKTVCQRGFRTGLDSRYRFASRRHCFSDRQSFLPYFLKRSAHLPAIEFFGRQTALGSARLGSGLVRLIEKLSSAA